jgi:hypothetical protein
MVAFAASCSNDAEGGLSSTGESGEEQRDALSDGVVEFEEYEAGFARFNDCVSGAGYPLASVRLVPESQLYDFRVPAAATDTGVEDRCYEAEWAGLDRAWQLSPERPRPPGEVTVEAVMTACLQEAGVDVPSDAPSPDDLLAIGEANGLPLEECARRQLGG